MLSPSTRGLNYSIKDHSGKDVTSFFQTMLYVEPPKNASDNLNDRQVGSVRPINTCGEMEGIFINSTCDREDALERIGGSMGAYTYNCLSWIHDTADTRFRRRVILPFHGECEADEICINAMGENELRGHQPVGIAQCVKLVAYVREGVERDRKRYPQIAQHLAKWNVDVSLSGTDQRTPLRAESINTEAGTSAQGGAKGSTQTKSCADCVDLMTDKMRPNTDFLDTEIKLLNAGVFAGILWLTVLSG